MIKLTTSSRVRIVSPQQVTVSANSELPYRSAAFVLDGKYHTYLRGATANIWPQSLTLKLAENQEIQGLSITQPETGPVTEGGYAAPVSERIKAYEVHVNQDGIHWGEPVAGGELRNQRGMQVILFRPVSVSYVRLLAKSNYGGTGTLQIISVNVLTL